MFFFYNNTFWLTSDSSTYIKLLRYDLSSTSCLYLASSHVHLRHLFFPFGGTTVEFGLKYGQNTRHSPSTFHNIQHDASIQTMECTMQLKFLSRQSNARNMLRMATLSQIVVLTFILNTRRWINSKYESVPMDDKSDGYES